MANVSLPVSLLLALSIPMASAQKVPPKPAPKPPIQTPLTAPPSAKAAGESVATAENVTVTRLRASIATLAEAGQFLGSAVLIGEDGRFIAHRSVLRGIGPDGVIATMSDGRKVRLFIDSRDLPTGFVLLQAKPWTGGPPVLKPVVGDPPVRTPLVAILGDSVFRAQISPGERIGIDRSTSRMLPLTELTFENTNGLVGGAALFTSTGEFVGFVTAVLNPSESIARAARNVGPANLVIGYSMAPDVTRRAVEGFLSPSRRPQVASLGIVCRDAPLITGQPGGGALVEAIDATSPAARAGMVVSDVIIAIGGKPIRDQIAFAKRLYALHPGDQVEFRVRRGSSEVAFNVTLGLAPPPAGPGN